MFFKKGKECPNSVIEQSVNYDEGYFLQCVKIFWMLGRWIGSKDSDISLYNLFSSTQESLRSSIDIYFKLLDELPSPVVESSFLTFLSRVKNVSEQSAKPGYMKLLKLCNSKFGSRIKPSVYRFAVRNKIRDELAFIDLLIDLR